MERNMTGKNTTDNTELLRFLERAYNFHIAGNKHPYFDSEFFTQVLITQAAQLYSRIMLSQEKDSE
jgi:hypothetical protein